MKHSIISISTISVFGFYYLLITGILPSPIKYSSENWSFLLFYIFCSIPLYIMLRIMHRHNFMDSIGLKGSMIHGFIYALLSVLPMLLYVIINSKWNNTISLWYLFNATIIAGFFEELFFRGLLFGQLFRYAKWGFIPAILIVSIIFGLGHIYQGTDLTSSALAGVVTGLGGVLFGWIYVETNYNLWCCAFLHILMNFSWTAFSNADNGAIGTMELNIVRLLTVLIAICLVIIYKKKQKKPFLINMKTLWINK